MSTSRLQDIDRAKGLAIALVVAGHLVARTAPADNHWYVLLKEAIYLFHMPFFMFLSGLVMAHCFRPMHSWGDYGKYARGKFLRLVPAYVLFGAVVLTGKVLAVRFLHVDNAPGGLATGIVDILLRPASSCASSLWYIYVLFAYYLAFPWLMKATRGRPAILLPLAVAIHFLPITDLFLLNRMAEYLVFVLFGALGSAAVSGVHGVGRSAYAAGRGRFCRIAAAVHDSRRAGPIGLGRDDGHAEVHRRTALDPRNPRIDPQHIPRGFTLAADARALHVSDLSHEHDRDRPGQGTAAEALALGRPQLPDLRAFLVRGGTAAAHSDTGRFVG